MVLIAFCLMPLARPAWAQQRQTHDQSSSIVALSRGIEFYIDGQYDAARKAFEQILEKDATNATASYYLGLINLNEGLTAAETEEQDPQRRAELANAARTRFQQAEQNFQDVFEKADPAATPVGAALLLGIAQLAGDDPAMRDKALELALRARETLDKYVHTDYGDADRFGYFYLGVAHYRLADEYDIREDIVRANNNLRLAKQSLTTAVARGRASRDAGRISAEEFARFETVVHYYEALIFVQERSNLNAIDRLERVVAAEKGKLGTNAKAILDKLQEIEARNPSRISVDSPIGPLEFDAALSFGSFFDSNVILLGKSTILPRSFKQKRDLRFSMDFGFNVTRYISGAESPVVGESLLIGVGGQTSQAWQPNIGAFDISSYLGRAFINWQPVRDLYFGLQYENSITKLGHDPFIASDRITPVLSKVWRRPSRESSSREGGAADEEAGRTDLFYTLDYRDYRDRIADFRLNRDGKYQAVGVQHVFNIARADDLWDDYYNAHEDERVFFGSQWLTARFGYIYRGERTIGSEFALHGSTVQAGFDVPLPHRFAFEAGAEFSWDDYSGPSIFDFRRTRRKDFIQRYDIGLSRTLIARGEVASMRTLEMKLRGGIAVTFQNSNTKDRFGQRVYEYDRGIYGLTLTIGF